MNADDFVTQLDHQYTHSGWSMWRSQIGMWCIKVPDGMVISRYSLETALAAASEYKSLPMVPRRPEVLDESGFTITKHLKSKWLVQGYGGNFITLTRKQAAEAIARAVQRSKEAADEWDCRYLQLVDNGNEGVDFRYVA